MKIGTDKKLHCLLSAVIAIVISTVGANAAYGITHNVTAGVVWTVYALAFVLTMAVGVAKELKDRKEAGNHLCWHDLAADAVGAVVGSCGAFVGYLL